MSGAQARALPETPRRVLVVGAGGTIAMQGRQAFDWVEYGESGIVNEVDAVLTDLPPLAEGIAVSSRRFRAIGSTGITPRDWLELAAFIGAALEEDPDIAGVVITHGTASLEESAYFLHLTLKTSVPVVVCGAQRPPNTASSDTVANLRAAVIAAAAPQARGLGVLVVMDGLVLSARDATKADNFGLGAFRAPEFGPLGRVEPTGEVVLRRRPLAKHTRESAFDVAGCDELPRVDIVYSYAGADGTAIEALVAAGARGLISAGLPPGRSTNAERAALEAAVGRGVLVVQASRAQTGRVLVQRYTREPGMVAAGDLAPQKARILAMLALTVTDDAQTIQDLFLEY